jgi:hypothetical protein
VSLVNLLSTGPGVVVYHLIVLLTLEAVAGIALIECRRTHSPDQRRILWAFGGLLALRILLLLGEPGGPTVIAPLIGGMELASLTLLGWAFLVPYLGRRAGGGYLIGGLGATLLCAVTFLPGWYRALARFPHLLYLTFWQQAFWYAVGMLLTLAPALVLLRSQRWKGQWLPALGFAILFLGFTTLCIGSLFSTIGWFEMSAYTLIGVGRLINLLGYPFFTVAVYHIALQGRVVHHGELEDTSEEALRRAQELHLLVEISRTISESLDLDMILRQVVESTTRALAADRCAIFLVNSGGPETVNLAAQYISSRRGEQPAVQLIFPLAEQPALAYTLKRRKQLAINAETHNPRLQTLYRLLGSQGTGPTIVQPLLRQDRILGTLVVGNDHSQRAFEPNEGRLCQSIAVQVAAAIENAYLYSNLEAQTRQLAESPQFHGDK